MGKIIAIDFGLKKTGIAITDDSNRFAFGLTTVESIRLMSFLKQLIPTEKITTIVLGYPTKLNTEDGHITENVRLFRTELERQFPQCKVEWMDERFTSKMAFDTMLSGGLKKKQRQNKNLVDEISATILLQDYLRQCELNN